MTTAEFNSKCDDIQNAVLSKDQELARLKREVEEEKNLNKILKNGLMFETWQTDFRELLVTRNELHKVTKERDELRERESKMNKYFDHTYTCLINFDGPKCDCGFDELKAALSANQSNARKTT